MKITVEVDCTPEEARRAMGLPDLTPLHARYIEAMSGMFEGGVKPEMLDTMIRNWAPMGEAGMTMWRRLFENGTRPGG